MSKKKNKQPKFSNDIVIKNRRARFEYEIIETFEAGLALTGNEVKSLRQGNASLTDVYAQPRGGDIYLRGMHIKPYEQGNVEENPTRDRQLLLHRREIEKLIGGATQKGLTIVPLKVYFNQKGWAKAQIGLARGKKVHDKRETIKQRDIARDMAREMKVR